MRWLGLAAHLPHDQVELVENGLVEGHALLLLVERTRDSVRVQH
jgi:hypothetical protein